MNLISKRKEEGINGNYFSNPFKKIYRLFFSVCLNVKYVGIIIESQSPCPGSPSQEEEEDGPILKCFQFSAGNAVISVSPSQTQNCGRNDWRKFVFRCWNQQHQQLWWRSQFYNEVTSALYWSMVSINGYIWTVSFFLCIKTFPIL